MFECALGMKYLHGVSYFSLLGLFDLIVISISVDLYTAALNQPIYLLHTMDKYALQIMV